MWCIRTLSTEDDGRQTFQHLSRSFRQSVQDSPLGFCHADLTPDTIRDRFTCQCVNVVYSIICRCCGCLYIGETERRLGERVGEHLQRFVEQALWCMENHAITLLVHLLPQHGTIHGDFVKIWEQTL